MENDNEKLALRSAEYRIENQNLKLEIAELEKTINNLNALIMEQVKVICDWVLKK